jgi:hypothetical protein
MQKVIEGRRRLPGDLGCLSRRCDVSTCRVTNTQAVSEVGVGLYACRLYSGSIPCAVLLQAAVLGAFV